MMEYGSRSQETNPENTKHKNVQISHHCSHEKTSFLKLLGVSKILGRLLGERWFVVSTWKFNFLTRWESREIQKCYLKLKSRERERKCHWKWYLIEIGGINSRHCSKFVIAKRLGLRPTTMSHPLLLAFQVSAISRIHSLRERGELTLNGMMEKEGFVF